jgi:hypothetical protein
MPRLHPGAKEKTGKAYLLGLYVERRRSRRFNPHKGLLLPKTTPMQYEHAKLQPNKPNPRERLRELLQVPESSRSDSEWEEIHRLELDVMTEPQRKVMYHGEGAGSTNKPRASHGSKAVGSHRTGQCSAPPGPMGRRRVRGPDR